MAQWGGNLKFSYPYFERDIIFFNQSKITNFFLPWGRIWELAIGIILAFFIIKKKQPYYYNELFCIIGLSLIIFSIFTFNQESYHPGFITLLPTIGTALLILFMNSKTFIYKIFSQKFLVFIGLISYSTYLFHYPIFTFIEYSDNISLKSSAKLLLIFIIFFISFISWKYFEKPFRNNKQISFQKFLSILFILYFCIFILFIIVNNNKGFKERFEKQFDQFSINFNIKELEEETSSYKNKLREQNNFVYKDRIKILIVGDSVAIDLQMAFDQNKKFVRMNWLIIILSIGSLILTFSIIAEKRYLYSIFPFLIIFSTIPIQRLIDYGLSTFSFSQKQKNISLIIIIIIILLLSMWFTMRYDKPDSELENEKIEFSKYAMNNLSGNLQREMGHAFDYYALMLIDVPTGNFKNCKVEFVSDYCGIDTSKMVNRITVTGDSVEEIVSYGKKYELKYILSNEKPDDINFHGFLDDIYHNDQNFPYLEKIFDSNEYGFQKLKFKIYQIDYKKFNDFLNEKKLDE